MQTPALLTRMSRPPSRSTAPAGDTSGVAGDVGVDRRYGQALAVQLADRRRVAGGIAGDDHHPGACASAAANALPSPWFPPVTSAFLPVRAKRSSTFTFPPEFHKYHVVRGRLGCDRTGGQMPDAAPAVLITGATAGLGRYLAGELAGSGWQVLVHGRDPGAVADLCAELGGAARAMSPIWPRSATCGTSRPGPRAGAAA